MHTDHNPNYHVSVIFTSFTLAKYCYDPLETGDIVNGTLPDSTLVWLQ